MILTLNTEDNWIDFDVEYKVKKKIYIVIIFLDTQV